MGLKIKVHRDRGGWVQIANTKIHAVCIKNQIHLHFVGTDKVHRLTTAPEGYETTEQEIPPEVPPLQATSASAGESKFGAWLDVRKKGSRKSKD